MLHELLRFAAVAGLWLAQTARGDLYMHMPRGSNNRLNERAANRNNANRLFDSQNNNRGGYNVGDLDPVNGFQRDTWMANFDEMYDFEFLYQANTRQKQYEMLYFENTWLSTTWTNQHGTGNAKLNSMMVLQFICDNFPRATATNSDGAVGPANSVNSGWGGKTHMTTDQAALMRAHFLRAELYNGGTTDAPAEPNELSETPSTSSSNLQSTYTNNNNADKGRRESEEYYAACKTRHRQKNLFHADQQLRGDAQKYTRQNPGGTRRGLECPEERDYYPWWNPSPFHDIAIITPDVDYCNDVIKRESQNVKAKYQCIRDGINGGSDGSQYLPTTTAAKHNLDEAACNAEAGYSWQGFKWGTDDTDYPECVDSYWSKVNHLGNVDGTKRGGKMAHYDWQLPSFQKLTEEHYCYPYTYTVSDTTAGGSPTTYSSEDQSATVNCVRMMFRMRYNMSTMDYDPYKTDASQDEDDVEGVISPIENNPTVDVGIYAQGLRLAINTAQTGRVFQDNSHTFLVCERPSAASGWKGRTVHNVNVRGKRGNIVQTFPAIEYDFEPQHIFVKKGECLHFQWTGSNTHNNGNPAGDGQAGDAGEGRGGSDRSNLVQSKNMDESYPITYDKFDPDFFDYTKCYHPLFTTDVTAENARLIMGTGGFYRSLTDARRYIESTIGSNAVIDVLMNNVSASFRQGLICCVTSDSQGEFSFISTRNNNFTNRSQKLKIIITNNPDSMETW